MKEKLIALAVFLIIMAMLPFMAAKCSTTDKIVLKTSSTADSVEASTDNLSDSDKILCGIVAAQYKDDYSEETMKAIAVIILNNYKIDPDSFDTDDKEVCILEKDANSSLKEIYPQIKNCVNSAKEISVKFDNSEKYIPFSDISNGTTKKDNSYDYLIAVASPWDCYNKNYDENSECVGVSLSGVDYLCKNGCSAVDALKWYLHNAEIK